MLVPEIVAAGGGLLFAFDHATIAGKLVLTLLAIVSIFSWSIMITKLRVIRFARKQNARFLDDFARNCGKWFAISRLAWHGLGRDGRFHRRGRGRLAESRLDGARCIRRAHHDSDRALRRDPSDVWI